MACRGFAPKAQSLAKGLAPRSVAANKSPDAAAAKSAVALLCAGILRRSRRSVTGAREVVQHLERRVLSCWRGAKTRLARLIDIPGVGGRSLVTARCVVVR